MKGIAILLMVLIVAKSLDTDTEAITNQISQLIQNTQTPLMVNLHFYECGDCGGDQGGSKIFDKLGQKPEKIFSETVWKIQTINGVNLDLNVVVDGNSITFDYHGKMRFTYVITGNKIKITHQSTISSLPFKPTPSQDQVKTAFLNSVNFQIVGDEFIFKDVNGKSLIEFAKQNLNSDNNIPLIDGSLDAGKLLPGNLQFKQIGYRPLLQDIEQIISKQLKGNWKVTRVGNMNVSFDASISESRIQYKYCNYNSWIYFVETNGSFRAVQEKIPAMMNCSGLVPSEAEVDQHFRSIKSFKLRGAQLHFFNSQGNLIIILNSRRFTPFVYPISQLWTTTLVGDVSVSIVVNVTDDFFQFTYTNEISMPYRISGDRIDIGLGWPGKLNTSEAKIYPSQSHVLTAFTRARSYVFSDSNLVLFDDQNNVVVKFKAGQHSSYVQNIPSVKKVWKATQVSNRGVCFYVNITDNTITYTYVRTKVFQYITKGNIIHLSPPVVTSKHKDNYKPSTLQQLIDDSFMSATNFRLQTNIMYLLNKDFRDVVTLRYYKTLTTNKGTINPKKSKF